MDHLKKKKRKNYKIKASSVYLCCLLGICVVLRWLLLSLTTSVFLQMMTD